MADGSHFVKNFQKKFNSVLIWNGQKCERKWISDIQNGRWQPFCQKNCIDLKWPELLSKVNFRHLKWLIDLKWLFWKWFSNIQNVCRWPFCNRSEMARNAIKSEFWTSKMSAGGHFVKKKNPYWSKMARKVIDGSHFVKNLLYIDLKWPEMRSKVNFGHPKCYMCVGGHFVKKNIKKFRIDLKWPEMPSKVSFGHPKWPPAAIL